jgi:divalent metal cation (Fe/Co/Zn/Cd) transporter
MVLVAASAAVMSGLYVGKMRIAARIQSGSLRAEAIESLVCDLQDLTVFVGLAFNALLSWWWADPVAALALIPFLMKEGREALSGDEHDEGAGERPICFCGSCLYGLRACGRPCCEAA